MPQCSKAHAFCAALLVAGCRAPAPAGLTSAVDACSRGAAHVEVQLDGTVDRYLGTNRSPSGAHEGFLVVPIESGSRAEIRVEDNIDLTGFIPLRAGERIRLQGQYECNDGVVHWTHHDPSGRHVAGYVEVNGRRYQ
jgi:Protein of unknown function (DUF3465)